MVGFFLLMAVIGVLVFVTAANDAAAVRLRWAVDEVVSRAQDEHRDLERGTDQ